MGFCTSLCKGYLNTINTIQAVIAIVIIVFSALLLANVSGDAASADGYGLPTWWGWVPLSFGVILLVLSILACMCVKEGNICLIFTFGILQLFFGAIILIAGSLILTFVTSYMKTIAFSPITSLSFGISPGVLSLQQHLSDYTLGLNTGCCYNYSTPSSLLSVCPSINPIGPCVLERNAYQSGIGSGHTDITSNSAKFCNKVGMSLCGDSLRSMWLQSLYSETKSSLLPSGIAFVVFGSLLLFAFIGTCVVGCKHKNEGTTGSYGSGV